MPEILIRPNAVSDEYLIKDSDPEVFWNIKMASFIGEHLDPLREQLERNSSYQSNYVTMEAYIYKRLEECIASLNSSKILEKSKFMCPTAFDGWTCWPSTESGDFAENSCPDFPILAFQTYRSTTRYCDPDGHWWIHPSSNKSWSNYTECIDTEEHKYHTSLNTFMTIGLSLSLIFLIISLILFHSLGLVKSGRVKMHRNLFMSNCLSNIFWLIWYHSILQNPVFISDNHVICISVHIIKTYLMVLNYFWMFCEGLYLQVLLHSAFSNDNRIWWIEMIGWLGPLPIVLSYSLYRFFSPLENQHCWMVYGDSQLFLSIPISIIVILNAASFINVLRIVRTKMNHPDFHSVNGVVYYHQAKTIAKTTLLLFPILGLHYILIPFRPDKGTTNEFVYDLFLNTIVAFQGTVVSILFCFLNGEVWNALSIQWKKIKESRNLNRPCKEVSLGFRQNPRRCSSFSMIDTHSYNHMNPNGVSNGHKKPHQIAVSIPVRGGSLFPSIEETQIKCQTSSFSNVF
ncbi:CALCRL [Lepeophtheirus salmonis]|uniref:CALCRL n=3 Tax=Lepeophtheirus salmonis TaxID=72036 RepID=A0A7R8CCB9_LEPSM|nr:CALCRL [Lepeophtheirus salmonis]CAF2767429.1 CALCRL [Lepeophtheirus salmonis]